MLIPFMMLPVTEPVAPLSSSMRFCERFAAPVPTPVTVLSEMVYVRPAPCR